MTQATLLMRLCAPMMSFGDSSRFDDRETRTEPTKSVVVALLCCAVGRNRWESVADLASLPMTVRVDQEGIWQSDFQVTREIITSSAKSHSSTVSNRHYLADANFLVALEGDEAFLRHLDAALRRPVWQMAAGRRAFPFSAPVRVGVVPRHAKRAIALHPHPQGRATVRIVREVASSPDVRRDVPLDFEQRLFGDRCVETIFQEVGNVPE